MATSSAPAKVFVSGEHAVVYGEPALLCALNLRATVTVETAREDDLPDSPYVRRGVERVRRRFDDDTPVRVSVESEIPVGAGLGSSAAVAVAVVHATARELGAPLSADETARLAHAVERDVQGEASRADTYASATGGFVRVEGDETRRVDTDAEPRFVVAHDGGSASTAKMVERVADRVERNPVAERVFGDIGALACLSVELIEDDETDTPSLGEILDINHGLLDALGVSSSSLSRLVWTARDSGGHAKLTGAGGAGCVVALAGDATTEEVRDALETVAHETYAPSVAEGVRAE